ncbi:MAG: purine-nucleoside phosphorylase [Chthoniobacterales bacterium]
MPSDSISEIPQEITAFQPELAIVLGSGLNSFVDGLQVECRIPYQDLPGFPASSVPGHAGCFSLAQMNGRRLLIAQGRVHLYEGWSAKEVTAGVRLFHALGIKNLILTNAAGSLNLAHPPGSWMMLSDHLNLTGTSPLLGGPHFVDMTTVYSRGMRETFRRTARELALPLHEGVYASLVGPQYETPAEIRMLQTLGADAVGMSTVLEAIQARALGMNVVAFSCLTNWGAGISGDELNHTEVTETGRGAAGDLIRLFESALPALLSPANAIV